VSDNAPPGTAPTIVEVNDAALAKASAYIEEEEGATSRYRGWLGGFTATMLVAMSLFHLFAAVDIVTAQVLRPVHVGFVLVLVFLLFPISRRFRNRLMWWDIVGALLGVATIAYLLAGGDAFWDRNTVPSPMTHTSRGSSWISAPTRPLMTCVAASSVEWPSAFPFTRNA